MNFDEEATGVSKETFLAALAAEGVEAGGYVPAPIPYWERLRTKGYEGPKTIWTKTLRDAGVDYRAESWPGCETKVRRSIDMDWNYIRRTAGRMQRLADVFAKVEDHLDALRAWEGRRRGGGGQKSRPRPSRREVLG